MTYWKLWLSKFKKFVSRSDFEDLQLPHISLNSQTSCCNIKIRGPGAKLYVASVLFLLWKELWRFKLKESMLFVEKNRNFNENKTELKIENLTHSFREMILVLQCASVILMLLCACVLSQCIVYWIKFQNGCIFIYQKTSRDTIFLLVFKITKSLQCILKLKNVLQFWNFKVFKNWCGMF